RHSYPRAVKLKASKKLIKTEVFTVQMPQSCRTQLSELARRLGQARSASDRMRLFGEYREQVLRHIDHVRDHREAMSIRVYIDRLERLSPDGEPWRDIFRALHCTLDDESGADMRHELA
ncbi:MAG TPA: hypothetical protein VN042_06115, partial [Asticcacaulis sp.]|nr:hypothetical protein [Asticcacaulis sp.]